MNQTGKHFFKLLDFTPAEIGEFLDLAAQLKEQKKKGIPHRLCEGKSVALIFEKISDANSIMGPEMKSTGEVLGIGRTKTEALYKGLTASGIDVHAPDQKNKKGILISVEDYDYSDAISLAEKFTDLGMKLYATPDTAEAIRARGMDVTTARNVWENNDIYDLLDRGEVSYVVYTGAVMDSSVGDFRQLHRRAMNLRIPCMTSIDTAMALADVVSAHYTQENTYLVDINR